MYPGCKLPNDGTPSSDLIPPILYDAGTSLNVINIGVVSIPTDKKTIDTTVTIYGSTTDDNGLSDISTVSYSIVSPNGDILIQGILTDNGIAPDVKANDGKYRSTISLLLPKEILGTYQIQVQSIDNSGLVSIVRSFPLKIFNSANTAPVISNLVLPDTIFVPTDNSVNIIRIGITASDLEGLRDIVSVTLTLIRPKEPGVDSSVVGSYPLYDDGSVRPVSPFGMISGDNIAADGNYSLYIPVPNTTFKNIVRYFSVMATDQSGVHSNVIVKKVHFQ